MNARDVFFEELEALTLEALEGLIKTFQYERHLAVAVSRISFAFGEFRCSASSRRKPRPLVQLVEPVTTARSLVDDELQGGLVGVSAGGTLPHAPNSQPNWKTVYQRDALAYEPSTTAQGKHWDRWQVLVSNVLTMCTSLSEVKIIFTNHYYRNYHRFTYSAIHNRRPWFPPPDLTNENIIHGLLFSKNLRTLVLTDPVPLNRYGPALVSWNRLRHLTITVTRSFPDFAHTAFVPPRSLMTFRFYDKSPGSVPWPLASDLAGCTNLQVLDLGVNALTPSAVTAIGFLCASYQNTLRKLSLQLFSHDRLGEGSFQHVLQSVSPLVFPELESLRLPGSSCDTTFFACFKATNLEYVEVGWLMLEPGTGTREEKWSRGLRYSSLSNLKELMINVEDADNLRKRALVTVCEQMKITLLLGQQSHRGPELVGFDDTY